MKKMKKLLSFAAAAVMSSALLVSFSANAVAWRGKDVVFEGYTECDRNIVREQNPNSGYYANRVFYRGNGKYFNVILTQNQPCSANFTVSDNADLEDVENTIKEICPDAVIAKNPYSKKFYVERTDEHGLSDEEYAELNLSEYQAKQICNALKEKGYIDDFKYDDRNMSWLEGYFSLPGAFYCNEGDKERLEAYFEETGLDFTVTKETSTGMLILDTSLTGGEAVNGMERIAIDMGVKPQFVYYMTPAYTDTEVIDMFSYADGDANDDGVLDISDAVSIMQAISNPDKYSLTAQGGFNADIAGDGDGITMSDALAVQEMLLGSR